MAGVKRRETRVVVEGGGVENQSSQRSEVDDGYLDQNVP